MKTNIFLSIVIPLFNKERFVQATINSVLNQTYPNFEIIVVDDCSTDESKTMVEKLASDKIKIVSHHINRGLSASRNTGIKHSQYDFVVFLDADDVLKNNYLDKIVSLITSFPAADLFATNYEHIYSQNFEISKKIETQNYYSDRIIDNFFATNLQQAIYCQSSFCVRKTAFSKIGYYNETINYAEDIDFNIRANLHLKLAYSGEKLVYYVKTDEQRITKKSIVGKTIPDFNSFETLAKNNPQLKKYLDVNRYMLANNFKKEGDLQTFTFLKNQISSNPKISGLTFKQRILLKIPVFVLIILTKLKSKALAKGFENNQFLKKQ